jgi:hypothetical protein
MKFSGKCAEGASNPAGVKVYFFCVFMPKEVGGHQPVMVASRKMPMYPPKRSGPLGSSPRRSVKGKGKAGETALHTMLLILFSLIIEKPP